MLRKGILAVLSSAISQIEFFLSSGLPLAWGGGGVGRQLKSGRLSGQKVKFQYCVAQFSRSSRTSVLQLHTHISGMGRGKRTPPKCRLWNVANIHTSWTFKAEIIERSQSESQSIRFPSVQFDLSIQCLFWPSTANSDIVYLGPLSKMEMFHG